MRKTILFTKVLLLLVAFIATSSSHATKTGSHQLLPTSTWDVSISLSQEINIVDDDKTIIVQFDLPSVAVNSTTIVYSYFPMLVECYNNKPSARAPPIKTLA